MSKMKNEDSSDFPVATIKIENEFVVKDSLTNGTRWTGVNNFSETSSVNSGETPEEKVKCCEQSIVSHTEALIKIEKREEKEARITSELVSFLSHDVGKSECDSKALLRVVKREKNEVGSGDESQSDLNHLSSFGDDNFPNEEVCEEASEEKHNVQPSFSHTKLPYVVVILKDLFPKKSVRGVQDVELRTDESHPCVYSRGKFKLLSKRLTESVVSNCRSSAGSKGNQKKFGIKNLKDFGNSTRTHFDDEPFPCPHCPSAFRLKLHLNNHMIIHSSKKLYSCAHCSMKFKRKGVMANHMIMHLKEKPHACPQCPMAFKIKYGLKEHLRVHTGEKPYSCPQCPARFSRTAYLNGHLLTHSDEKPYGCNLCPAKFRCKSNLNRHEWIHSGVLLKRCAHCCRQFKTERYLRLHVLRIHCGREKRCKGSHLKEHEGTHSGIMYHCADCGRQFKAKSYLRLHVLHVHYRMKRRIKKRYQCSHCHYRACNPSRLKCHLLSHSGEKPFVCDHCSAKFGRFSHLKRHAVVHTDERPFSCEKCQKTFRRKDNLSIHCKRHSC